jgi:hypothetical protein
MQIGEQKLHPNRGHYTSNGGRGALRTNLREPFPGDYWSEGQDLGGDICQTVE